MQNKALHIVSFDNPFPAVYGGIIEVFYKLEPLQKLGFSVYLHCFVATIPESNPELEKVVKQVFYYKNSKSPFSFFSILPFSVQSRNSMELLKNLNSIDAPILFEGLKTTYLVHRKLLGNRHKILRLHNIEHDYFNGIAASETNWFCKMIYYTEGFKFRNYEKIIAEFQHTAALSKFEDQYVNENFGKSTYIPVFHGNTEVAKLDGIGRYALYHGDLRMSDNLRVAENLAAIFKKIPDFKLIIASNSGESHLKKHIGSSANIEYVTIQNFAHLKQLLNEAHINLIFSYQRSGTKLKLMNALYYSRFCFINENIADDDSVTQLCEFTNSNAAIIEKINAFKNVSFTDYENRKMVLERYLNDSTNAAILANLIFEKCN